MYISPSAILALLTNLLSICVMSSTSSWLIAWMMFELNLLSFIPLMHKKSSSGSPESMIKYFLVQALGSILLLVSLIADKSLSAHHSPQHVASLAMLLKMGAAPIHQWLPSVSEGLPWAPLGLLLTTQKIMPLVVLMAWGSTYLIVASASASALLGSAGGYNQTSLRKLLAYSSITHMGWMTPLVWSKALLSTYWATYSLLVLTLAASMAALASSTVASLANCGGSWLILMNLLSLGGLPPLLGFLPKWLAIESIMSWASLLLIPLILGSLVNLSFYLSIGTKGLILEGASNMGHLKLPSPSPATSLNSLSLLGLSPILMAL